MYNSSPRIHHNTITNNGSIGITCDNYSNPVLYNNTITGHTSFGLRCYYYSSPWLANKPPVGCCPGRGYNVIRQNAKGISVSYGSEPFLGWNGYGGYNCVHDNTGYEIEVWYNCNYTVKAEKTYWNNPDPPSDFFIHCGTINSSFPLSSDPNGCSLSKISSGSEITGSQGSDPDRVGIDPLSDSELSELFQLELEGRYEEARVKYAKKFNEEKMKEKKNYILTRLVVCYKETRNNNFINFLNEEVRQDLVFNDDLYATTLELENIFLIDNEQYYKAIDNLNTIKANFADNEIIYKSTIFNLGYIYLFQLNDIVKGKEYFNELKNKYPDDPLVAEAQRLLGQSIQQYKPQKQWEPSDTKDFALLANYPNPFNPTTTIEYSIPEASFVELKIYDILGGEVASLVKENKPSGKHSVKFNASNLPSGIYFYRIVSGNFTATKKLIILK